MGVRIIGQDLGTCPVQESGICDIFGIKFGYEFGTENCEKSFARSRVLFAQPRKLFCGSFLAWKKNLKPGS